MANGDWPFLVLVAIGAVVLFASLSQSGVFVSASAQGEFVEAGKSLGIEIVGATAGLILAAVGLFLYFKNGGP